MAGVTIKLRTDGPIQVTGEVTLTDGEGNVIVPEKAGDIFLCRCGLSTIKPYCDGAHKKACWSEKNAE